MSAIVVDVDVDDDDDASELEEAEDCPEDTGTVKSYMSREFMVGGVVTV